MDKPVVIGIDRGGTFIRVSVADKKGRILAHSQKQSHAYDTPKEEHALHVRQTIREAVASAGIELRDVDFLVAGVSDLGAPEDQARFDHLTAVEGLCCPREHVNDAVVAQAGAFAGQPGIVAISGTGSNVYGVTEDGCGIRNYDFHHYARSAAAYLAYDAVHLLLAGEVSRADDPFIKDILAFWNVADVPSLRARGARGFMGEGSPYYRFSEMAPIVTFAAQRGHPLARAVCDQASNALATGIRLVGECFRRDPVSVALVGAVAQSSYMGRAIALSLSRRHDGRYLLQQPTFSPATGAILLAYRKCSLELDEDMSASLRVSDPWPLSGS